MLSPLGEWGKVVILSTPYRREVEVEVRVCLMEKSENCM